MVGPVKRIVGLQIRIGGNQHSGWLPAGAAVPLPTSVRDVVIDLEIEFDGFGYLLCYASRDGSVSGDTWHPSLNDAEQTASEHFGIQSGQWEDATLRAGFES
jgi:hypothetical protein